jgi:hypothetical protein
MAQDFREVILREHEVDLEYEAAKHSPWFLGVIERERCPMHTFEDGDHILEWRAWAVCAASMENDTGFLQAPSRSPRDSFMYWMTRLGLAETGGDSKDSDFLAWYFAKSEDLIESDPDEMLMEAGELAKQGWRPL